MPRRLGLSALAAALPQHEFRPVEEPVRNRRAEAIWTGAIFFGWLALAAAILVLTGLGQGRTALPAPWFLALGVAAWFLAEELARRRGMVWPGSMLGLVGPISLAYAFSLATPQLRMLPPLEYLGVVYGATAVLMIVFLARFKLAGIVSPLVTFSVIALFLGLKGSDPKTWSQVEGISPRGFLAAMIDAPLAMALFGGLAAFCMVLARRLDLHGDWFGIQAARPLHLIGSGVAALVLGRLALALPVALDLTVLLALYLAGFLWAMRIDRVAVMVTIWFAMARPLVLSLAEPAGVRLDMWDWTAATSMILGVGLVLWGRLRMRVFVPIGWTMQPRNIRWNWPERVIWPPPKDPR